jgi:type I restriction enzyme S subunit
MLCDKIFRVVFLEKTPIYPEFLAEVMKLPTVRQQIEAGATGTSPTMKNISKPALLELTFPLPQGTDGLDVQLELVSALRAARQSAKSLRAESKKIRDAAWSEFLNAVFH